MNIHPVRAVGILPEFHAEACGPIPLDCDLDDVHVSGSSNADAYPIDPLSASLTESLVSSEGASVPGNQFEHIQQLDDDMLDNMIVRCFESDTDGTAAEMDMVSVDEITFATPEQTEQSQALMDEMDISLSPVCPAPDLVENVRREAMGCNQTHGKKKRGIKKGKRSRAPARPWTEVEHQRFEESLELFGRNWEQCAAYIGTRRAQLVRSHAQKHLIKLWKLGKSLPKKVAESGTGYTLSGKPLLADSASARSYLTKIPCPDICEKPRRSPEHC